MADDPGTLALVIAAVNEPETKKRLAELQAKLGEIEAAKESLREQYERNAQTLAATQEERREADAAKLAAIEHERVLAEKEAALTRVIDAHTDERSRWEEMRVKVDAEHTARETAMREFDAAHLTNAEELSAKETELAEREAAIAVREEAMRRRETAMRAALDDL